jgi:hypothetical protein
MLPRKTIKPRKGMLKMETLQINDTSVHMLIQRAAENVSATSNIPVAPRLHTHTFLDLAIQATATKNSGLMAVAMYLACKLDKERCSVIHCTTAEITSELHISPTGITACLAELSKQKLITKISRSSYEISPRLAFYGSAFDWSIALSLEGKGQAAIDAKLNQIDADIKQAEDIIIAKYHQ